MYKLVDTEMDLRRILGNFYDHFFLQGNHGATCPSKFFKKQHLRKHSFRKIVKDVCKHDGIIGDGEFNFFNLYGLRATMISLLLEVGHEDSAIECSQVTVT